MNPTEEQVSKLPKWAQDHFRDCKRRRDESEQRLKDYLDSQSESLVFVYSGLREKQYIQTDRVTFKLSRGEVTIALRDDTLECHGNYGSGSLVVRPWSSNVFHATILEDI